jgi:hypothetical protein
VQTACRTLQRHAAWSSFQGFHYSFAIVIQIPCSFLHNASAQAKSPLREEQFLQTAAAFLPVRKFFNKKYNGIHKVAV